LRSRLPQSLDVEAWNFKVLLQKLDAEALRVDAKVQKVDVDVRNFKVLLQKLDVEVFRVIARDQKVDFLPRNVKIEAFRPDFGL